MVFRPTVTELGQVNKILAVFRPASVEIVVVARNQIHMAIFERLNGPFAAQLRAGVDAEAVLFPYSRLLGQYPKWGVRFRSVDNF